MRVDRRHVAGELGRISPLVAIPTQPEAPENAASVRAHRRTRLPQPVPTSERRDGALAICVAGQRWRGLAACAHRAAQQQQQEQVESAIGPSHRHDRGAPWSALATPQSSPVVGQAKGAQPVTP